MNFQQTLTWKTVSKGLDHVCVREWFSLCCVLVRDVFFFFFIFIFFFFFIFFLAKLLVRRPPDLPDLLRRHCVWFTFCTTLELFRYRWMDVLRPSQIHRHKIPSFSVHFRRFLTPRQKSSEKAPCVRKPLTPFWDWLKLVTRKSFTKWEVCTFRIGASRCGESYDRFRERSVTFFYLSTSGVWKQVDPRIHR